MLGFPGSTITSGCIRSVYIKTLRSYESRIQQLDAALKEHNTLLYPTTSAFIEWYVLKRPLIDTNERGHEIVVEKINKVLETARKYIAPDNKGAADLKNDLEKNEEYQRNLRLLRARVKESIMKFQRENSARYGRYPEARQFPCLAVRLVSAIMDDKLRC